MVAKVRISFVTDRDVIIPPFSSKASRTIIMRLLGEENPLFSQGHRYKPYCISPIFLGDKPLIRGPGPHEEVLKLQQGREYGLSFTALRLDAIEELLLGSSRQVVLFDANCRITGLDLECKEFTAFGMERPRLIRVSFLTPALLKLPSRWVEGGRRGGRPFLYPVPSLLIWSLAQHWNHYAPEGLRIEGCKRLAAYSNFSLVEEDYSLRPFTVIYDEQRRPKGFVGWVRWSLKGWEEELDAQLLRLLEYANFVGVGRSRAIGFGMVRVEGQS